MTTREQHSAGFVLIFWRMQNNHGAQVHHLAVLVEKRTAYAIGDDLALVVDALRLLKPHS